MRDVRNFCKRFSSVIDMKVKLIEEFEDQVPPNTGFVVGYFQGRQSTKKWICDVKDLEAMYSYLDDSNKKEVCLWCDGRSDECENENSRWK